jgi:GGDEF domain-containing protein
MYDASARFTSAELVRRADENLYAAKRAGCNRVVG